MSSVKNLDKKKLKIRQNGVNKPNKDKPLNHSERNPQVDKKGNSLTPNRNNEPKDKTVYTNNFLLTFKWPKRKSISSLIKSPTTKIGSALLIPSKRIVATLKIKFYK
jgi:hypothetical protein